MLVTNHLRLNRRQLSRVVDNLPKTNKEREEGFPIPDKHDQSPYKTARIEGGQLVLLKNNPKTGQIDEYGAKLPYAQYLQLYRALTESAQTILHYGI